MTAHLLDSTAVALLCLMVCALLRGRGAGVRHALLLVAVVRFAIPTSWLIRAGGSLACFWPVQTAPSAPSDFLRLVPSPAIAPIMPASHASKEAALIAWLIGGAACIFAWLRRSAVRITPVREPNLAERQAFERALGRFGVKRVDLSIPAASHAPGVRGLFRSLIVLPDALSEQLTSAELESVLAHECAHVRRFDNAIAALVRLIVAVFWFHPLLWWIERRMLEEREQACDEAALSAGASAEDYVAAMCKVCGLAVSGAAGYAGAAGSNLKKRMEEIMSWNVLPAPSRWLRMAPAAVAFCALLIPAGSGFLRAQPQISAHSSNDDLYQSACGLFKDGKYPEAEDAFRRLMTLEPGDSRGAGGLADVYLQENRVEDAVNLLQTRIDRSPQQTDVVVMLGNVYARAKQYDRAIAEYQRAIDTGARNLPDIYFRIGEAQRRKGDLDAAMQSFDQARRLDPNNVAPLLQLALIKNGTGRQQEAASLYEQVLKLEPTNPVALNNLAYNKAADLSDLDQALALAQAAAAKSPHSPDVADTLGWVYLKRNQPDQAIAPLRTAISIAPQTAMFHLHLAMALNQTGDRAGALGELNAARQDKPSQAEQQQIRAMMDKIGAK